MDAIQVAIKRNSMSGFGIAKLFSDYGVGREGKTCYNRDNGSIKGFTNGRVRQLENAPLAKTRDMSYTQNRELSWLKFNERVLAQAVDEYGGYDEYNQHDD